MDYVTADSSEWQPIETVPKATKCWLLTQGGIAVVGIVVPETEYGYLAWAPMPKMPQWLRERLDSKR